VIGCLIVAVVLLAAFGVTESRVANPMFDLSLLRVPTFSGGAIAAFAMNGSLYAMLLYFVIYLQDVLGYSALAAGLRIAVLSLAQLATSVIAGRLSSKVPTRWLIGPGLLLVGIGLIVMSGLNGDSAWTHLVPGFIVAGLGGGLVNPPLASTAIGVVPPQKAGMASGVNSTFRQVGIATGIAALGSIFTSAIGAHLSGALPPSLAGRAGSMTNAVREGSVGQLIASVPAADRAAVGLALRSSFAAALNELLYVTAVVAIVGAVCAVVLIRAKDFHRPDDGQGAAAAAGRTPAQEPA
jgi:predicted MFS family arabinose efflux permease